MATHGFKYFCVLDFEASWNDDDYPRAEAEIIEFPTVLVDAESLSIISEFHTYVKKEIHPEVHPECTAITAITQSMVDNGMPFVEVLGEHRRWMEENGVLDSTFAFVTCGDWDLKTMLPRQCTMHNMETPEYARGWINIKTPWSLYSGRKLTGMAGMLKNLNLELTGHHHSGIDDCRNIAKIVIKLLKAGVPLELTGGVGASGQQGERTHGRARGGRQPKGRTRGSGGDRGRGRRGRGQQGGSGARRPKVQGAGWT